MFRIDTDKDFLQAFRPRDRKHVEIPPELKFPLVVLDCLTWTDGPNGRSFVVFNAPGDKQPTGVAFRRDQSGGGANGARLCEWCHTYGAPDTVGLLTTDLNSKKRVGISLCLDLACAKRVEEVADRSGRNARVMMKTVLERMARFTREALKITPECRD